jgi:transcription antitermination factor NusG
MAPLAYSSETEARVPKMPNNPYPHWYAVHTFPRAEAMAYVSLKQNGYEAFFPHQRVRHRRRLPGSNRFRVEWTNEPYFSRYIFAALVDEDHAFHGIVEARGVSSVVGFGGQPIIIPHKIMDAIIALADDDGKVGDAIDRVSRARLKPGQRFRISTDHPLAGFIAQVSLDAGKDLRIWLKMLGSDREMTISPRAIGALC